MTVAPLPRGGTALLGRDIRGRALRVTPHPEHGRVVLSIWDGDRCAATVRLAPEDVPELVRALADCLVDEVASAAVG
jgi:class 3 adenylate cyclase